MVVWQAENEESSQMDKDGRTRDIWAAVWWPGKTTGSKTWPRTSKKTDTKHRCRKRLISIYVCILKCHFLKSLGSIHACRCSKSLELDEIVSLPGITMGTHTYVALPKAPQFKKAAVKLPRLSCKSAVLTRHLSRSRKNLAIMKGHQPNANPEDLFCTARSTQRQKISTNSCTQLQRGFTHLLTKSLCLSSVIIV